MREVMRASVLVLALCGTALAGDMPTPPAVTPPPGAAEEPTTKGNMPFPLVELALRLLSLL